MGAGTIVLTIGGAAAGISLGCVTGTEVTGVKAMTGAVEEVAGAGGCTGAEAIEAAGASAGTGAGAEGE